MKEALVIPTWVQSMWYVLVCVVDITVYMGTVNVACAVLCSGHHSLHGYSQCGMCCGLDGYSQCGMCWFV